MRGEKEFKNIFPNGEFETFLSYFHYWEKDLDMALWAYGGIRPDEYIEERKALRQALR